MITTLGEQSMAEKPSSGTHTEQVRAILFREGDVWVGQCIEYDICTHADNLTNLNKKLEMTIQMQRDRSIERYGSPFAGIPPAPPRFEEMWNKQSGSFTPADNAAAQHKEMKQESIVDLELALCA
jgi:hypothetical protein